MLSPVSLRICWVAAMAPALTEAANQADNFALPCSPGGTVNLEFSALALDFIETSRRKLNSFSFMTLGQLASPCKAEGFDCNKRQFENIETSSSKGVPDLPWNDAAKEKNNNCQDILHYRNNILNLDPGTTNSKLHRVQLSVQADDTTLVPQQHTMSKNVARLQQQQDTMGLLNTNTALDSQLKLSESDCIKQSAFSSHEQMLLFSDPEKEERCADIDLLPLEVDNDKLSTTATTTDAIRNNHKQSHIKEEQLVEWTAECKIESMETCYASLRKRTAHIIQRIRKLQMRHAEHHIADQLKVLRDNRNKLLEVPRRRVKVQQRSSLLKKAEDLLQGKDVRGLTTTALIDLIKEIEQGQQQGPLLDDALLNSLASADFNKLHHQLDEIDQIKETNFAQEIYRTVGPLRGVIHHLQSTVSDSEATDSSSGGESSDEMPAYSTHRGKTTSLHKRSYWRWTLDRAAVATRWVWLQAQISDLEYKIRQQNEVYRQLRLAKGSVTLQETQQRKKAENVTTTSENKSNNNNQDSRLHKSVNGFWSIDKPGNGINLKLGEGGGGEESTPPSNSALDRLRGEDIQRTVNNNGGDSCSRTRPLKCFKKRRVVRTMGLHFVNRRVSKLSSVRCHCNCQRDYLPCITCGGRYNCTQSVDVDTMPFSERVSLLDPSFHPRLSLKHETQTGIQYENLLRRNDFQKSSNKLNFGLKRKRMSLPPSYCLSNQARKHSQKLTKNAAQTLLSSERIRKSFDDSSSTKRKRILREKRNSESICTSSSKRVVVDSETTNADNCRRPRQRHRSCSVSSGGGGGGSKPPSPSPSPIPPNGDSSVDFLHPTSMGKVGLALDYRRRRLDDAYDINNIVIPYSIASATRLEKLQYKEILTPKWRLAEQQRDSDSNDDQTEDISDETYLIRHQKCEVDERKKFSTYANVQGRTRSRSTRVDSFRADSSGANTPDPMSPAQSDYALQDSMCAWNSPVSSPPPVHAAEDPSAASTPLISGVPAHITSRRRTTLIKRASEEERQFPLLFGATALEGSGQFSSPYDMRTFPLPDQEFDDMIKNSSHLEDDYAAGLVRESVIDDDEETLSAIMDGKDEYSYPATPVDVSSNGSPLPEDDPNDPEWALPVKI